MKKILSLIFIVFIGCAAVYSAPPSRFPSGVNNSSPNGPYADIPIPVFIDLEYMMDDFNGSDYMISWVTDITATDLDFTTSQAQVLYSTPSIMELNPGSPLGDMVTITSKKQTYSIEYGKKSWFGSRVKISDPTTASMATYNAYPGIVIGLLSDATTALPYEQNYGVYFSSMNDRQLDFNVAINKATIDIANLTEYTRNTWTDIAFYYNGLDEIKVYVDGVARNTHSVSSSLSIPSAQALYMAAGIRNTTADTGILDIDYIMYAKER